MLTAQWLIFRTLDEKRIKVEDKREAEVWVEETRLHNRRLSMEQALAYNSEQTPMHVTRERPDLQGPRTPILPPLLARSRDERPVAARRGRRTKALLATLILLVIFGISMAVLAFKTSIFEHPRSQSQVLMLMSGEPSSEVSFAGVVTAYICASLYLGSRLPQLWHSELLLFESMAGSLADSFPLPDYSRGSVQGLSIELFVLATVANICYIASITTSSHALTPEGEWDSEYLLRATPFFLTAGGAMAFDQVILAQWICEYSHPAFINSRC